MSFLGTYLTLLIGPTVPVPAPTQFLEALESVEVFHSDQGRSGFQLTFQAGRDTTDLLDYALLSNPLLQVFNRVVMVVTFGAVPQVLMDGLITQQQLSPANEPGSGTLTVTGEDVSVAMDLEEKSAQHPAQNELVIAVKLIASYAQYGLIPKVIPPPTIDIPLPTERIPVQQGTDLEYLQEIAGRHGYVFYVVPGPVPLVNTAYWGPPERIGIPQRALSVAMGPNTNVNDISFQYNGLGPTFVSGQVQDRMTNQTLPVQTFASTRPPLGSRPAWLTQSNTRTRQFRQSGLNTVQAIAKAQAETDLSVDEVVSVTGELDAARYEGLLKPRGLVGLRGAGYNHDGFYYVKSVSHKISKGEYKQSFTLKRDGVGALSPVVAP